jgi:hypothetical protein
MGFLGKLLGTEKELPPLDPSTPGAGRIEKQRAVLEAFVAKLHDPVEMVPGEMAIYAFIGRPPDRFGIAWFMQDGAEHNLKTLIQAKKLTVRQQNELSAHLREAYERSQVDPRFAATIGAKKVKVVQSPGLEKDLLKIIHDVEG